jgi:hypothetical protein
MGLMPATEAIDWWRNQHAYPLRLANAGVRYYTGPDVSQRLKRFGTMVDKLHRHPHHVADHDGGHRGAPSDPPEPGRRL